MDLTAISLGNTFRQYLPSKYVKHRIKCYALCDSATGYCLKFKIYTGRDINFDKTLPYNYSIVMDFISPNYIYNNHKLYTVNYYTSFELATDLNKKKIKFVFFIILIYKEECKKYARHDEPEDKYRRKH